ncbi:MAG: lipoyl synthase [Planctomycetes bacterium]|nr:lipoyl synthase [Planctomycetota bacterium]
MKNNGKLPPWLKRRLPANDAYDHTHHVIGSLGIETICTNANCPNKGLCWEASTATVLILGNICTRNCKFCSVAHGKPAPPDPTEPKKVAAMAKQMSLKYLVITSVDRDDLQNGGAEQFAGVVTKCREENPNLKFELLVPDFKNCQDKAISILAKAMPFVFGHNIETVPPLYPIARPGGDYKISLKLLEKVKSAYTDVTTKSSIMLGLGEKEKDVIQSLKDLRNVNCDRIAIGQYLRPTKQSLEVIEYIEPEKFDWWKQKAYDLGFKWVMSSPFTRSSYNAHLQNTE